MLCVSPYLVKSKVGWYQFKYSSGHIKKIRERGTSYRKEDSFINNEHDEAAQSEVLSSPSVHSDNEPESFAG